MVINVYNGPVQLVNLFPNNLREVVKKRIFYGQADRKHLPLLPPLEVSFHGFFLVCLNLDYDSYVF